LNRTDTLPELKLKRREDRRLRVGHLWIYSNEVDVGATPLNAFEPGDLVRIVSDSGRFLGYAGVNPHSLIAARIIGRDVDAPPGRALITRRLRTAAALRNRLYPEGHYRLCFGEADALPGLVIDRFGEYFVCQAGTATMERMKGEVLDVLRREFGPAGVLWRNDGAARLAEGLGLYVELASGAVPEEVTVVEGGVEFSAPVHTGQKTGWFFDQRDNRRRLARYPADLVLDVFSYTGAWGLTAALRGARATFVDSSAPALASVAAAADRLGVAAETVHGSALDVLRELCDAGRRFDCVILDPPAFIKRKKDHRAGLAAYQRINQLALRLLTRDGLLVSCSCSHHLTQGELIGAIQRAARHVDRFVQIVELGGQSADHPIHPAIPETAYLKAIYCRVLAA
jgi:23S rRNA (cytosine1962-C5)-methyltransferase